MKSVQTKGKSKKRNEKLGKAKLPTKDTNGVVSPDLSSLRKPIDTSVSDLCQVSKLLENGTDEVKSILSYECNIIYECRTCHSLFRSIVNLISHKREYCRKKFDITLHRSILHNYNSHSSKESIIQMCKTDQTIIKDNIKNDRILRSQVSKESHKKDLSTVIDMLNKKREENMDSNISSEKKNTIFNAPNNQHIYLESINTNCSAVYQTVKSPNTLVNSTDLMKEQVAKSHQDVTEQNTITLKEQIFENQLEKSDSPIQIDMSDEENELLAHRLSTNNLTCTICNVKFSTKKTLTVHMKLHTSQRICYPCPCCTSIFANSWSVYRHLYKVHRKTNEQVRKLRSQIQEGAFYKEVTMEGLENAHATKVFASENETIKNSDNTQKSANSTESSVQRCGRRKKRFNTKRALPTPLQYCETPIATCEKTTTAIGQSNKTSSDSKSENMLCETEDVNTATTTLIKQSDIHSKRTSSSPEIYEENETSIHVQRVSSLSKEDWDMLQNDLNYPAKCNSVDNNNDLHKITASITQNVDNGELLSSDNETRNDSMSNTNLQSSEIICTNISEINSVTVKIKKKKEKISDQSDEMPLVDLKEKDVIEIEEDSCKLQPLCSIQSNEKSQTSLMERMATIANFQKLQCLLCKRKFTSMPNLRRHMAIHIGWNRYRCKLCDFKCFVKCDCVAHCNKMHNAQNNRAIIAEIIVEIPQNEYTCNENIILDVMNTGEKVNEPEIMDLTASSCQSEICIDLNNSNTYIPAENEATTTANEHQEESNKNVEHQDTEEKDDTNEATTTANEHQEESTNKNVEHQDTEEKDDTIATVQNLAEYMMNSGSGKLDAHPDLKRVVMEVIFGSSDTSAIVQTNKSDKSALTADSDARECINDNENSIASNESIETREPSCSISDVSSTLDNLKQQRPIRNRMKPLRNDFIYDLKEIAFRKECTLFNDSDSLHIRKKAKLYN